MKKPRRFAVGKIVRGATCYVPDLDLEENARPGKGAVQIVRLHGAVRAIRLPGDTWLKSRDVWSAETDESLSEIVERCQSLDLGCPSGHGDIYRRKYRDRWLRPSLTAYLRGRVAGAWEQALEFGDVPGRVIQYDQRSAYAWAAARGLPAITSFRPIRRAAYGERAIYDAEFVLPGRHSVYPPPFRAGLQRGLISGEEAEAFDAEIRSIQWGVTWDSEVRMDARVDWIQSTFPQCQKRILRAFWGAWIATEPIVIEWPQVGISRAMKLPYLNPIWGYLTISRVKLHQWRAAIAHGGVRVYVDSVMVREPIDESEGLGGWRREAEWPTGIRIEGAARIKDLATKVWIKHSGISTKQLLLSLKPN